MTEQTSADNGRLIAQRLRELGLQRVLFGADLSIGGNPTPAEAWRIFRSKLPLTAEEFEQIAGNAAPYMR